VLQNARHSQRLFTLLAVALDLKIENGSSYSNSTGKRETLLEISYPDICNKLNDAVRRGLPPTGISPGDEPRGLARALDLPSSVHAPRGKPPRGWRANLNSCSDEHRAEPPLLKRPLASVQNVTKPQQPTALLRELAFVYASYYRKFSVPALKVGTRALLIGLTGHGESFSGGTNCSPPIAIKHEAPVRAEGRHPVSKMNALFEEYVGSVDHTRIGGH